VTKQMIEHLTPAQFDALLIGDTHPAAASHLAACAPCTAEFSALHASIGQLSAALTNMAREELLRRNNQFSLLNTRRNAPRRPIFRLTATLALAASVAIVAAVVPFGHLVHQPVAHAPITAPVSTVQSDEALLNEINQQLSASVPSALAPLADPSGDQISTNFTSNTKD
jgi:anti-sigma factor RsiW